MTTVRQNRATAVHRTGPKPAGSPKTQPAADSLQTSGPQPPAGWTAIAVPAGATLTGLALGDPDVARQIQHANLGREGWTDTHRVKPGGLFGWLLALFGVRETKTTPRFAVDAPLPADQTIWLPTELDPSQHTPPGYKRLVLPHGDWSLDKLSGGYRDLQEAFDKGNPGLAPDRLAKGGLYVNLPDDLPLQAGLPAAPTQGDRASADALAKLEKHLQHREDPHALDAAHGLIAVRPGDTPLSLAKLLFNDPARWQDLVGSTGAKADTDLAKAGWTAVALPKAYRTPDWGDIFPLHPSDPFLQKLAPAAARIEEETGVPAAVTLAQAAVESAMGTSRIGDYNVFGIKGEGSRGSIRAVTTEYSGGRPYTTTAEFADFGSWDEAMKAHAELFDQDVYAEARKHLHDPIGFAKALNGIYATDPNYAATLIETMKEQNLLN